MSYAILIQNINPNNGRWDTIIGIVPTKPEAISIGRAYCRTQGRHLEWSISNARGGEYMNMHGYHQQRCPLAGRWLRFRNKPLRSR